MQLDGYIAALAEQGPTRGPQNVFINRPDRQGPDDRARDHRRLQRGVDQGAQPRGAPVHRDAARRGRRERAPDEGGGALPRQSLVHEVVRRALMRRARPRRRAAAAAAAPSRPDAGRPASAAAFPACSPAASIPSRWRQPAPARGTVRADGTLRTPAHRAHLARHEHRTGTRHAAPSTDTVDSPDDAARPVPRHVHHRGRRRGHRDHRPARRARARAVRAHAWSG